MNEIAQNPPALMLGTAHASAIRAGTPSLNDAQALIKAALARGITLFDTDRAAGLSEVRLGRALAGHPEAQIVTKLAPLEELALDAPAPLVIERVRASIEASAEALGRARLDTVLLSRARHLRSHNGAVWDTLLRLQAENRIGNLGASLDTPEELRLALSFRAITQIEIPFNLLDWRWRAPDVLALLALRPDVCVQARAILLEGLLDNAEAADWPSIPGLDRERLVSALAALVDTLGRASGADLCLAYARAMPFLQRLVLAPQSAEALGTLTALAAKPPLEPEECQFLERFLPRFPEALLNPALWPAAEAA